MSTVKKAAKAALLISAGAAGFAAAMYEVALNVKVAGAINQKFSLAAKVNSSECENQNETCENYEQECENWFSSHKGDDRIIKDDCGNECHAYIIMNENKSNKWVISCHGFTSGPDSMGIFAYEFYKRGYNCILPSLRGHGNDTHKYCSMGYHDRYIVTAFIEYIILNDPNAQIVLHGVSMGAATTMLATGEELPANVKAAISDCGYTNCYEQYENVIERWIHIPVFPLLPVLNGISILRGNFDFRKSSPVDAVENSKTPTLFIHGDMDNFVPYYMLDDVYAACSAPKAKLTVEGATHTASSKVNPVLYWNTVDEFLKNWVE